MSSADEDALRRVAERRLLVAELGRTEGSVVRSRRREARAQEAVAGLEVRLLDAQRAIVAIAAERDRFRDNFFKRWPRLVAPRDQRAAKVLAASGHDRLRDLMLALIPDVEWEPCETFRQTQFG